MTAPEDRFYCDDPLCDGDHLSSNGSCDTTPEVSEPSDTD